MSISLQKVMDANITAGELVAQSANLEAILRAVHEVCELVK